MVHADVHVQVTVYIVISDGNAPCFPGVIGRDTGCGRRFCQKFTIPQIQFNGRKTTRHHQVQIFISVYIEPDYTLWLRLTLEQVLKLKASGCQLHIGRDGTVTVPEGQILKAVRIKVSHTHARSQKGSLR